MLTKFFNILLKTKWGSSQTELHNRMHTWKSVPRVNGFECFQLKLNSYGLELDRNSYFCEICKGVYDTIRIGYKTHTLRESSWLNYRCKCDHILFFIDYASIVSLMKKKNSHAAIAQFHLNANCGPPYSLFVIC